ncbi:hypothetical protein CFP65_3872 [Kitasatospora sp. MMS16-BH015]|uniref:hypothetical protein n=1 Tax=Kitasatospora sp. MMS16-BH015 TaxID=2018025 RepID=UPI000CA169F8|nr:hypothetical protein [Kitasatospora sp. MMS16-BH015]AUG78650.1 hypothetical protein CFP65_3872 [Kitasatospora sp. MMS16-BH015]
MAIPREPNGRPLTLYTMSLDKALDYAREALAEGLNVEIKDMDLRDTLTYRTFQESPILAKYWAVAVTTDDSANGYRSKSAHQVLQAVDMVTPEQYGAIHAEDLVAVCRSVYSTGSTEAVTT